MRYENLVVSGHVAAKGRVVEPWKRLPERKRWVRVIIYA
jgi:hypothetical protein